MAISGGSLTCSLSAAWALDIWERKKKIIKKVLSSNLHELINYTFKLNFFSQSHIRAEMLCFQIGMKY